MKQEGHDIGPRHSVIKRSRNNKVSVSARKNWRKALDDIKEARQSGIYSGINNETEEITARERVKSILQSNLPSSRNLMPKSAADSVCLSILSFLSLTQHLFVKPLPHNRIFCYGVFSISRMRQEVKVMFMNYEAKQTS